MTQEIVEDVEIEIEIAHVRNSREEVEAIVRVNRKIEIIKKRKTLDSLKIHLKRKSSTRPLSCPIS